MNGRERTTNVTVALAALLAGSVAIDLLFFTGFLASDDVLYTTVARNLVEKGRLWPDLAPHEARLLMIGWCALACRLWPDDVQAVAASFVFFHQALTVLTFVLARAVQGLGGALVAAALSATFPLLVVFSTTILPDIPMTVFLVVAFVALRAAGDGGAGLRRMGLLALSGGSVGFAYLAKESALVPVPFLLAMTLMCGRSTLAPGHRGGAVLRATSFLAGLLLVLGLEALALRALTGSWFVRLGASFAGGGGTGPSLAALGRRAAVVAGVAMAHPGIAATLVAILLATSVYARKRAGLWAILLFPAWYAAYYAWGSVSLRAYYAPTLQARYFIPCVPFVLVAVSVVLCAAYDRAAERARRFHPPRLRTLPVIAATAMGAVLAVQLALIDRSAGTVYGAPLVSQSLRALRSESPSTATPIVLSERLGAQIFPLFRKRPEGLLFSHEVKADQLERWRSGGGFRFMDLNPTSPLRDPKLNPLIGWRHGLPPSEGGVERLVESLLSGEPAAAGWAMRPAGRFDLVGSRSAEIRALFGDAGALPRMRHRPDRGVLVFRLAGTGDDLVYPLPAFAAAEASVVNGTFDRWTAAGPAGWQARDSLPSRVPGPEGAAAVHIGPGAFSYLWQSLPVTRSARGRTFGLRARVRSDHPGTARLWIKVAVGAEWEEVFGEPHPGDGTWRPLEAVIRVPPEFTGGEVRIVLLHGQPGGGSEFANVELSVR